MKYEVDKTYLGDTRVHDSKLDGVIAHQPRYRYPYNVVSILDGKSLFTTDLAENVLPMPTGLLWSVDADVSKYDWSGVALAVDINGGQPRDSVVCCTLVSPHYACVSNYNAPVAGDTVYFLNADEDEITRTVAAKHDSTDVQVSLIEFTTPIDIVADKLKIYGIVDNYKEIVGRELVSIEQNRKIVVSKITSIDDDLVVHKRLWSDEGTATANDHYVPGLDWNGNTLNTGDSSKPGFLAYEGEMLIVVGGHKYAHDNYPWVKYANEFDVVMSEGHSESLRRITVEETKFWPRQGDGTMYPPAANIGFHYLDENATWSWFWSATDRTEQASWPDGVPLPCECGNAYGRYYIHNPGGLFTPMPITQFADTEALIISEGLESDPKFIARSDWDAFTTGASTFAEQYELGVYFGQPQALDPLPAETKEEWVARAKLALKPVLDIRPRPQLCLDAVYGQESAYVESGVDWTFLGGNSGAIAMLYDELANDGYQMLHEPWTRDLADSTWAKDFGTLVVDSTRSLFEGFTPPWSMGNPRVELVPYLEQNGRNIVLLNDTIPGDLPQERYDLEKSIQDRGWEPAVIAYDLIRQPNTSAPIGQVSWCLATIPDIQVYTGLGGDSVTLLRNTIQWIIDNRVAQKIEHVAFLGDLTNHDEYYTIDDDPSIPSYFPSYFVKGDNSLNSDLVEFNPGKYYQGAYRLWTAPTGREWLIMNLDYWADKWTAYFPEWTMTQKEWAQGVIETHPNHSVLIITHSVLQEGADTTGEPIGIRGASTQIDVYDYLTNKYPNIQMVLGGHTLDGAWLNDPELDDVDDTMGPMATVRQHTTGQEYNKFHEIIFNSQELLGPPRGGNGFIRLYDFMEDDITVNARTYEYLNDTWWESNRHKFTVKLNQVAAQRPLNREPDLKCLLQFNETTGDQEYGVQSSTYTYDSTPGQSVWRVNFWPNTYDDEDHWILNGKFGRGLRLGRASGGPFLETNNDPDLTGITYTVAMWFKIQANPTSVEYIMRKQGVNPTYYKEFYIELNTDGTLTFTTSGSGGTATTTGVTSITLGEWNHVAMSCTGSNFQGYLNGTATGANVDVSGNKVTALTDIATNVNELQIFGGNSEDVDVDDFRYYSRDLNATEVASLASNPYGEV
jgi:hypothetical protein